MAPTEPGSTRARWLLVAVAAATMGAAGTYQFVWSSLSGAIAGRVPASETALGTVFTLFVVAQALVQLPAGSVRDRYGPRGLLPVAGVLLFVGFAGTALAGTLPAVAASYAAGGLGSGIAYTVAVNTPVKWFGADERRGLATGLVTMAYGGVSVVAIPLVRAGLDGAFESTLLALGGVLGAVGVLAAVVLRDPGGERPPDGDGDPPDAGSEAGVAADADDDGDADSDADPDPGPADDAIDDPDGAVGAGEPAVGWRGAVRTWQFWTLFGVMLGVNGVGLMLIGQSVGLAGGLGLSAATATTAASVVAAADGAGILVVGGLSDRFGDERTLAASLVCAGVSLAAAVLLGGAGLGVAFVVLVGAAAFFRSPAFSIVPTIVGRYYGSARSSENYAAIYLAKIPGGVVGGTVAASLVAALGWSTAFLLGAVLLGLTGVATRLLRPVEIPPADSPPSTRADTSGRQSTAGEQK
jgi:OFA family oxalate/formate antiporter-like MFS transporter